MNSFPEGSGKRENRTVFPLSYSAGTAAGETGIPLFEDETVEDLQRSGLRLIQKRRGFRFGEDSVLLAHHAADLAGRMRGRPSIADLGCGCGFLTVLLSALLPDARLTGYELDPAAARAAVRNLALNGLHDRAAIETCDLRDASIPGAGMFDLAVCNPPYREPGRGAVPADPARAAATVAGSLTLDELAQAAHRLLRTHGTLVMTQLPGRLPDVLESLRRYSLEPRSMREILPAVGCPASILLVTAVRDARPGGFSLLPPLTVRTADGRFTAEVGAMYGTDRLDPLRMMDGLVRRAGRDAEDGRSGG